MKRVIVVMMAGAALALLWTAAAVAGGTRFVVTGKTVEDTHTRLIWARNANLAKLDWAGAAELIQELNADGYAGAKNWRLPSREELMTLANLALRAGYVGGTYYAPPYDLFNRMGFRGVQPNLYWSSSSSNDNPTYADVMNMCNGKARSESKESQYYIWPVRGRE